MDLKIPHTAELLKRLQRNLIQAQHLAAKADNRVLEALVHRSLDLVAEIGERFGLLVTYTRVQKELEKEQKQEEGEA